MLRKIIAAAALFACVAPVAAFAYDGSIAFKGGCKVSNSGSCQLAVTGQGAKTKIYTSATPDGKFGVVSNAFDATTATVKRIANSTNNVCFYAKATDTKRTRTICLAK